MFIQTYFDRLIVIIGMMLFVIVGCKKKTEEPSPIECKVAEFEAKYPDLSSVKHVLSYNDAGNVSKLLITNTDDSAKTQLIDETVSYNPDGELIKISGNVRNTDLVRFGQYFWGNDDLLLQYVVNYGYRVYNFKYDSQKRVREVFIRENDLPYQMFTYIYNDAGNMIEAVCYEYTTGLAKVFKRIRYTEFDDNPFMLKDLPYPYYYNASTFGALSTNNPVKGYILTDVNKDGKIETTERRDIHNKLTYNEAGYPTSFTSNVFGSTITIKYECE